MEIKDKSRLTIKEKKNWDSSTVVEPTFKCLNIHLQSMLGNLHIALNGPGARL